MTDVHVRYSKFDGSLHWNHDGHRLGEDEFGVWVGMPPGTTGRRGYEPPVVWEHPHVMVFPRDSWWTAIFHAEPAPTELYCDITTVPEWSNGTVCMVDLDLDVFRRRGGPVEIDDEDEFAEHQVRYGYPPDVIAAARLSCDRLAQAVRDGAEPFAARYRDWLDRVIAGNFR